MMRKDRCRRFIHNALAKQEALDVRKDQNARITQLMPIARQAWITPIMIIVQEVRLGTLDQKVRFNHVMRPDTFARAMIIVPEAHEVHCLRAICYHSV